MMQWPLESGIQFLINLSACGKVLFIWTNFDFPKLPALARQNRCFREFWFLLFLLAISRVTRNSYPLRVVLSFLSFDHLSFRLSVQRIIGVMQDLGIHLNTCERFGLVSII